MAIVVLAAVRCIGRLLLQYETRAASLRHVWKPNKYVAVDVGQETNGALNTGDMLSLGPRKSSLRPRIAGLFEAYTFSGRYTVILVFQLLRPGPHAIRLRDLWAYISELSSIYDHSL